MNQYTKIMPKSGSLNGLNFQLNSIQIQLCCSIIALSIFFLTGCSSTTYSRKITGWGDLKTFSEEFDPPLVVMAPKLKLKSAWWGGAHDGMDSYDNPFPANPVKQHGNVVVASSYEQLANIIRENEVFSFAFINRKQGSYPNPITTTVSGVYSIGATCTLCILPVWYPNNFTVDNSIFYYENGNVVPLKSGFFVYKKGYRTRADSFVGFSWFILPHLRKYTKKNTYEMEMQRIANEAYYAYDCDVIENIIAVLYEKTKGDLPAFTLNDNQFEKLILDAFGVEYNPNMSYLFSPISNWSRVDTPESIGEDYKKGHLYIVYNKIKSLSYDSSPVSSGMTYDTGYEYSHETVDLGPIRDMGPALVTWMHTRKK